MILVDSSVWIDHMNSRDPTLTGLLSKRLVLNHPFVIGELALGNIKHRAQFLEDLQELRAPVIAKDEEVLRFITQYKIFGMGIGYVDAHLLASTQLTPDASLWTRDKRLQLAALKLGLAAQEAGDGLLTLLN